MITQKKIKKERVLCYDVIGIILTFIGSPIVFLNIYLISKNVQKYIDEYPMLCKNIKFEIKDYNPWKFLHAVFGGFKTSKFVYQLTFNGYELRNDFNYILSYFKNLEKLVFNNSWFAEEFQLFTKNLKEIEINACYPRNEDCILGIHFDKCLRKIKLWKTLSRNAVKFFNMFPYCSNIKFEFDDRELINTTSLIDYCMFHKTFEKDNITIKPIIKL